MSKELATESGHWYDFQGNPRYTLIGKNGKERNTTLADARKGGLVPSVTGIRSMLAAPGLTNWIIDQHLDAALTLPRIEGESADDFKKRVKIDANAQKNNAASLGTAIHTSLEKYSLGEPYDAAHERYVRAAWDELNKYFPHEEWRAERSFAHRDGFGGKVDLHSRNFVIDYKTTGKPLPEKDADLKYIENAMQLAAYGVGLLLDPAFLAGNVFISTVTGEARYVQFTKAELKRGWLMFECCLKLWQLSKDLVPFQSKEAA